MSSAPEGASQGAQPTGVPGTSSTQNQPLTFADVRPITPVSSANQIAPAQGTIPSVATPPPATPIQESPSLTLPQRLAGYFGSFPYKLVGLGLLVAAILVGSALIAGHISNKRSPGKINNSLSSASGPASAYNAMQLPLSQLVNGNQLTIQGSRSLVINGQLDVNNSMVLAPTAQPVGAVAGQLYFNQTSDQLSYYNGSQFVNLLGSTAANTSLNGGKGIINIGNGLASSNGQIVNTGVLSLQGQSGAINLGGGLAMSGSTLSNSGILSITSSNPNLTVTSSSNGTVALGLGQSGSVSSTGGTAGNLAVFTGTQTLANSLISQSGTAVTVNGDLSVTGNVSLSNPLGVLQGGTGVSSLADDDLVIGGGTSGLATIASSSSGQCLLSTNGAPQWVNCPGGTFSSLDGLQGNVLLADSTGAGNTVTIQDSSTSQLGLSQFNATNFTVSSGDVDTIQDIDTAATPTFAGINTGSINPAGSTLTVGSTSSTTNLQGGQTMVSQSNGGSKTNLEFQTPTANVTYLLQTAALGTYNICTTAGNCVGEGGGVTTAGGTAGTIAKFTASQGIGNSELTDNGTVVNDTGNLSVQGTVSLTNALTVSNGGTGATTMAGARTNLGAAASGANSDITSLSGLTTALSVLQGGTGATALTANGVLLGNGTGAISSLVAGSSGQCLVSTGGAPIWESCSAASGGVTSLDGLSGGLTIADSTGTSNTVTIQNASTTQEGIASFNGTNFTVNSGVVNTAQNINSTATPTFATLNLTSSQASANMFLVNNTNTSATGNLLDLQSNGNNELTVDNSGDLTLSGTINGQTISSAANLTGSLAVGGTANLNGGAAVTGTLTANTISPTGAMTVGSTGQSLTLQGNGSTALTATAGGKTTTLGFQSPTANVAYTLLTEPAGSYNICTTAGNCSGVGGGVTTAGGTVGTIPVWTAAQTLGNSSITDNGTDVGIGETLNVNTIDPTASMTVGDTGQNLTLQGSVVDLSSTHSGITNTVTFTTPSGSAKTITFPNASGTVAVSASGPIQVDANGNISCPTCLTSGGGGGSAGVSSVDNLTGALSIADSTGAGTTVTLQDASTSQLGLSEFNSTNFTVNSGVVDTSQDLNTTAAPTFGQLTVTSSQAANMLVVNNTNTGATGNLLDLELNGSGKFYVDPSGDVTAQGTITSGTVNGQTISNAANFTGSLAVSGTANLNGGASVTGTLNANTITPTGSAIFGSASQAMTLQGSTMTITSTSGSNTTSLSLQAPTANVTYTLLTEPAGSYNICTTAGNCAGVGGGVTTAGGTSGDIAVFTGTQAIGNSLLSESGSTVTVGGNLNLTSGNLFEINNTQISSANLSDGSNLAKLNAAQTFTGNSNVFENGTNSANAFEIENSSGYNNFSVNTSTGAVTFGNITTTTGQGVAGQLILADGTADGYGLTLQSITLTANQTITFPNASGTVCLENSTACGFAASTGSSSYIQNGTTIQAANFNVQGSSSTAATAVITANNGGSGDILDLADGATLVGTISNTGKVLFENQTNSSSGFEVENASGYNELNVNTTSGVLTLGNVTSTGGAAVAGQINLADGTTDNDALSLLTATLTGNQTITLPNASGTVCLDGSTSCGFATSSGAGNYIQNGTGTQSANFNVQAATSGSVAGVLEANGAGSGDILDLENGSAAKVATIGSTGATLFENSANSANALEVENASGYNELNVNTSTGAITFGNITSTTGHGVSGQLILADGSADNDGLTLQSATLTGNQTITFPNASGTVCLQSSASCGFALSSGSGNYINNTASTQSANLNVQAATSGSVAGVLEANSSGNGDILDLENGSGVEVATVGSTGNALFQASMNSSGAFQVLSSAGTNLFNINSSSFGDTVGTSSLAGGSTSSLGYSTIGSSGQASGYASSGQDLIAGSEITTPSSAGVITSISVYMGANVQGSPNNDYQVGVYTNNSGVPGSWIASSSIGTLTANAWNTLSLNIPLSGNTNYWLIYTTNTTSNVDNGPDYTGSVAGYTYAYSTAQTFDGGADNGLPATFPSPTPEASTAMSEYATYDVGANSGNVTLQSAELNDVLTGSTDTIQTTTNSADAFEVENSLGYSDLAVNTSTGALILGNITATTGDGVAGNLTLADGTADNYGLTINTSTLSTNQTISFPNLSGTVCLEGSTACSFAPASGSSNYIDNVASTQAANLNIQAATSGSVAGTFEANASGSGDVLDLENGSGAKVATVGSSGAALFENSTNSSTAFVVENASGYNNLAVNTSTGAVTFGNITTTSGHGVAGALILADGTVDGYGLTIQSTTLTTNQTVTFPNATGTVCLQSSASCGFILNQTGQQATSNFNISGTGVAGTELETPLIDTASAGTLTIGQSNATAIQIETPTLAAATGNITIETGNATGTSHSAGSVVIDTGTSTGTGGLVSLGDANATTINIGSSSSASTAITIGKNGESTVTLKGTTFNIAQDTSRSMNVTIGGSAPSSGVTNTFKIGNATGTAGGTTNVDIGPAAADTDPGTVIVSSEGIEDTVTGASSNPSDVVESTTNSTAAFEVENNTPTAVFTVDTTDGYIQVGSKTGNTNTALLVLNNYSTQGSDPTEVDGAMYYNSGDKSFRCGQNGIWRSCSGGLVNSSTAASSAISNTSSITNFSGGTNNTYSMLANDCQPGVVYNITANGVYSTTGSPTLAFSLDVNGTATSLASTGTMAAGSGVTNSGWQLTAQLICDTTGSSGTAEVQGSVLLGTSSGTAGTAGSVGVMANSATQTLNTTGANALAVGVTWGSPSTSNTITQRQFIVTRVGP